MTHSHMVKNELEGSGSEDSPPPIPTNAEKDGIGHKAWVRLKAKQMAKRKQEVKKKEQIDLKVRETSQT